MKEYKGWQIVKMLDEKILKVGEELTVTYGDITKELVVVANFLAGALYLKEKDSGNLALPSYFVSNAVFRKKLKPLTFFEAIAKADKGEKVTNDCLEDENGVYKGYYFKYNNKLYYHKINYDMDAIFNIHESEMTSSWYIYEE